jgi:hypothetical protein
LVPGVERVVKYEYFDRCETWCVQGPSRCVGEVCKKCGDANANVPQYDKIWQPTCGPSFTCSRLWKRPVVVQQPVLRCVLEDKCSHCGVAQAAKQSYPMWALRKRPSPATQVAAGQPAATAPAPADAGPSPSAPAPYASLPPWLWPTKIQ